MCVRGDTVTLTLGGKRVGIDRCISGLVVALNAAGFNTVASCYGHGYRPRVIALVDGREIILARDYEEARAINRLFPVDINGEVASA